MLLAAFVAAAGLGAQAPAAAAPASGANLRCLVLPFHNHSDDPSLDWMGESFVVGFRQALASSGVQVLDHADRQRARGLLGAAPGVVLSHASMLRMARNADVRWLVMGWFRSDGTQLTAEADLVDLEREHLVHVQVPAVPLRQLQQLQATLGAQLRRAMGGAAASPPAPSISGTRGEVAQGPAPAKAKTRPPPARPP
ncbi:MAG: hypothetical protein ACRD1Y_13285, partial [Terriglobales bacterium]